MEDPTFWPSAFGFLGTAFAGVMALIKFMYSQKEKAQVAGAKLDASTERLKSEYDAKLVLELQHVVDGILPVIEEHTKALKTSEVSIHDLMGSIQEVKATQFDLSAQYKNFLARMNTVQAGGQVITERLAKIETVVEELSSGNVFVRTKK